MKRVKFTRQNGTIGPKHGIVTTHIGPDINPALKPKYCRTKLANGSQVFPGIDKRTWFGRHIHELYFDMVEDKGGNNALSTMEHALLKQLASLITTGEMMARNKAIEEHCYEENLELPDDHKTYDYLEHLTLVRTCASVGKQLGLKRQAKTVKKDENFKDYIQSKSRKSRRPPVIDVDYSET